METKLGSSDSGEARRTLRAQHKTTVLAVTMLAVGILGCRSASNDLSPEAPAPPEETAPPVADAPGAPEATPAPGELPDGAFADAFTGREPVPGDLMLDEEEPATEPEEMQRWALELCQSAEQLLDEGDVEGALAALDRAYELMLSLPDNGDDTFLQAKEDIRILVADLLIRHYRTGRSVAARPTASWDLEIPIINNDHVRREIESFTTKERKLFVEGYRRSGRYRPMILAKLEEAGLPSQLSWLPMVESWFKVRAYSRASAVGMWQFISSTGLRYGLGRDAWVDERFDPEKSTDAAIAYLVDLHGLFGDWPKALAAYNCGEARVQRLQRRSATEYLDFWDLYELLPRETRRYVPRLFAALQIIENPEKFGMTLPDPDPPPADVTTVTVERAVKLEALDELLGLDKGTLGELNPELRYRGTPRRAYDLKVPSGHDETLVAGIESVPEWRPPQTRYVIHRVRRGQTLSVIAQRYGTSVRAIQQVNNLRSANRIRTGQRLRIPVRGSGAVRHTSRTAVNGIHTVRRGESLGAIANAYGTTVSRLKRDNGLTSDVIYPGQKIRVGPASDGPSGAAGRRYTVARGDTLGAIAARHGVGLSALLRANGLTRWSTIYPGQELVIPN
jgi:membrane-bound lytic murein transglycosylase D